MLCKKPYMLGVLPCGCGQCLPCRINRRRLWVHRMLLECVGHAGSCFVTLTYNQINLPVGSTLESTDVKNWLKRLRKAIYPQRIRYYLVGEYGDKTNRPHYHAAIFGLSPEDGGGLNGLGGVVQQTWGKGHSYVGDLSPQSASYICGYVTKKMTKKSDPRLLGRNPEFARMSLRPGIGALVMKDVAGAYTDHLTVDTFRTGSFPVVLAHGRKSQPLGRYLRSILRQELGYGRETTNDEKKSFHEKMRLVFEDETYAAKKENRPISSFPELNKQKILMLESKYKMYDKKGSI